MTGKFYKFINGEEVTENLNDVELEEIIADIVMSNSKSAFQWDDDGTLRAI